MGEVLNLLKLAVILIIINIIATCGFCFFIALAMGGFRSERKADHERRSDRTAARRSPTLERPVAYYGEDVRYDRSSGHPVDASTVVHPKDPEATRILPVFGFAPPGQRSESD